MRIRSSEEKLSVFSNGLKWMMSARGGEVEIQALHPELSPRISDYAGGRAYHAIMKFERLIARGHGMNMEALRYIGEELRHGLPK